jgi:hypothetical protein
MTVANFFCPQRNERIFFLQGEKIKKKFFLIKGLLIVFMHFSFSYASFFLTIITKDHSLQKTNKNQVSCEMFALSSVKNFTRQVRALVVKNIHIKVNFFDLSVMI